MFGRSRAKGGSSQKANSGKTKAKGAFLESLGTDELPSVFCVFQSHYRIISWSGVQIKIFAMSNSPGSSGIYVRGLGSDTARSLLQGSLLAEYYLLMLLHV